MEEIEKRIQKSSLVKLLAPKPMLVEVDVKEEISKTLLDNKILGHLIQSRGTPNKVRCTICRTGCRPFTTGGYLSPSEI